jgi:hypothetical protein
MDVTADPAKPFSEAKTLFMSDGKTWKWLTDSGASHHMTSMRGEVPECQELTDRFWVKGISARGVGVGSVRVIVKA